MSFLYSRPDESFMFGTVSGTVSTGYDNDWLLDGRGGRPVRGDTGLTLTATAPASRTVGIIALVNSNVTSAVTVGAHSVPAPEVQEDGIPLNPWVDMTPFSTSSLVVTATQTPCVIGELWAGTKRTLGRQLKTGVEFEEADPFEWEGEFSSQPPYDPGIADPRRIIGETYLDGDGLADVRAWYRSTRRGTRPSLIVPIDTLNDAWLVTFRYKVSTVWIQPGSPAPELHLVTFEFLELPRVRW